MAQIRSRTPVIIIRRTHVVAFTVTQLPADTDQENGAKLFRDRAFAPFRIQIRVTGQQLLAVNKVDLLRQERRQTKFFAYRGFGCLNAFPDSLYRAFQGGELTLTVAHNAFPVPLIDIDGVERGEAVFVRAKGFHVRVQPFTRAEVVLSQRLAFPLCQ